MYSWSLIAVISLVAFILLWVFFTFVYKKQSKEKFTESKQKSKPKVVLVHASWCQHCVDYISSKKFDDANAKIGSQVTFEKLDYDENKALAKQYGVSSFPSIVGVSTNGSVKQFEGNREDINALVAFASSLS
jgi:thioredoxin-like negative regulator of GroEL